MDIIKKFTEKRNETSEKFKFAQEERKIQQMLDDREKSANERELERYMKQKREDEIKEQLKIIHHKQDKDNWCSDSILSTKPTILNNDRPILKEKHIFMDKKNNIPIKNNTMGFFKW